MAAFNFNHGETGPAENGPHYHIADQDQAFGAASVVSTHDLREVEPVRISVRSGEVLLGILCGEAAIVDQLKLTIEGINRSLTWKLRFSASYDIVLARFTTSTRCWAFAHSLISEIVARNGRRNLCAASNITARPTVSRITPELLIPPARLQ